MGGASSLRNTGFFRPAKGNHSITTIALQLKKCQIEATRGISSDYEIGQLGQLASGRGKQEVTWAVRCACVCVCVSGREGGRERQIWFTAGLGLLGHTHTHTHTHTPLLSTLTLSLSRTRTHTRTHTVDLFRRVCPRSGLVGRNFSAHLYQKLLVIANILPAHILLCHWLSPYEVVSTYSYRCHDASDHDSDTNMWIPPRITLFRVRGRTRTAVRTVSTNHLALRRLCVVCTKGRCVLTCDAAPPDLHRETRRLALFLCRFTTNSCKCRGIQQ